jgi:hypothetical protein
LLQDGHPSGQKKRLTPNYEDNEIIGITNAMNKIVREHYPASKLPADLRPSDDPLVRVTVTVEEQRRPDKVMTLEEIFSLSGFRRRTKDEIDAEIRRMRDEWDD